MKPKALNHQFVEYIPEVLQEGTLYISMSFATAAHLCCCGCGKEVVTPFSPTDWLMTFDGETISLAPSIGNWSFPCRSHYFIKKGKVIWAEDMSIKAIEAGRIRDRASKAKQYAEEPNIVIVENLVPVVETSQKEAVSPAIKHPSLYQKIIEMFKKWFL